jgi:hypothetical protein
MFGFRGVYVFDRLSRDLRPSLGRLMDSASATLESPLDSNNHIIAQVLCPVQRSFMQRFQLSACPPIRVLNAHACLSTAI